MNRETDARKARAWVIFDAKSRRCEKHNQARYYCGCYFADPPGPAADPVPDT